MQITRIGDRLVVHFLNFVNDADRAKAVELAAKTNYPGSEEVNILHSIAVDKAKKHGGKAYKGRAYGGGIGFSWSAWSEKDLREKVLQIQNS